MEKLIKFEIKIINKKENIFFDKKYFLSIVNKKKLKIKKQ